MSQAPSASLVGFSNSSCKNDESSELNKWVLLRPRGHPPSPRSAQNVVVLGDCAYVFGGCGGYDEPECMNEVHRFDFENELWQRVFVRGAVVPDPRASSCACASKGTFLVIGGTATELDSCKGDVFEFDARTSSWEKLSDDSPKPMYGQSVCRDGERFVFFGGTTGVTYADDVYTYEPRRKRWSLLPTTGSKPSPRYKHTATVVGRHMYVIGGGRFRPESRHIDVYRLHLDELSWESVDTSGDVPRARTAHSSAYDAGKIYVVGGFDKNLDRKHDFCVLDLASATWTQLSVGDYLPGRAFSSAVFYRGALYTFFGANGDQRFNDVWRYRIRAEVPRLDVLAARVVALRLKCPEMCGRLIGLQRALPEEMRELVALS